MLRFSNAFFIVALWVIQLLCSPALCNSPINDDFETITINIDSAFWNIISSDWKDIEKHFVETSHKVSVDGIEAISQVGNRDVFTPVNGKYISIDPDNAKWIKTRVRNNLDLPVNLALWVQASNVDVYILSKESFDHKVAGDFYPVSLWDSKKHYEIPDPYTVNLKLSPGEIKDIYIRLGPYIYHKVAEVRLTSYNHSVRYFSSLYSYRNLIQGGCMGMFLIMFFLNLFIFLTFRDRVYLLNTLYSFCLLFWFMVAFKLDKLTFLGEYPVLTELLYNPAGYGIGAFYILFVQAIIGKNNIPKLLNQLIRYYMHLIILAILVSTLIIILSSYFDLLSFAMMKYVFPPVGIIGVLISLYFIYFMFRLGTRLANIIAISSCFVLLGALIALFEDIINLTGISSYYAQYSGFSYNLLIEITFLIQLVLFGLALGIRNRAVENEKDQLKEIDQIKTNFFTNISHEFRTPLTLLLGPVKQVMTESKSKKHIDLLNMAYKSGDRLLNLINQILDLSKIDAKSMKLDISQINIVKMINDCLMMFGSQASQRNISVEISSNSEEILLYLDRDKMEKVMYNLLSNAIKFSSENGAINISINEEKDNVKISIRDNGIGIEEEDLSHVFDRFYQTKSGSKSSIGSGIGLSLVKELVELHKGNIYVSSESKKGTTFIIVLKKGKSHLRDANINFWQESEEGKEDSPVTPMSLINTPISITAGQNFPVILVIEDHPELHEYIKSLLSNDYQVFSAYNGAVGIEKAIRLIPDLIISDVMIPEKDGFEVCEILKTDERTSHIPIILLTAKADMESKIHGLEIGADDYLPKPFDNEELVVRIKNIIVQRTLLRQKFKNEVDFIPDDIGTNARDKQFMTKLLEIINQNMTNGAFGVEDLAKEIGMSKTQLNRKLRNLVDQSTNKFIQSCRLKKALELLKNSGISISEISYQTGFSSDAYFVKCFKEQFGVTPGKYYAQKPLD